MAPDVDARGGDVAFVLTREGNAGGAGSAVVVPGQDGGVCVGGWHGV